MDFGLGLVLSFTDKASAGIQGAVMTLNGLQSAAENSSSKLDMLGSSLSALGGLGKGLTAMITAPITAFLGKITSYGIARASFVEDMHLAFTSLMGDAKEASDYMNKLMDFAKTTPYTYEGITSAAQTLISYGYEQNKILDETNGQFGGILQAIGDWAGATGRGEAGFASVAEIIGKINAEGKVGSLRLQQLQLAGIQASNIIGNMYDMATDRASEFIKTMDVDQFISDLMKGLEEGTNGVNGLTGAMAGQMMNLKNTWTGAKDTFVSSLKNAGLQLMGSYVDEMGVQRYKFLEDMTGSLNNISSAVKQIPSILQPLMNTIQSMMTKGSELVLKFTTAWSNLGDGTKEAIGKIVATLTLLGPALLIVSKVGGSFLSTFSSLFKFLKAFSPQMLKFGALVSLLAIVWKSDFANMRTNLTWFIDNVKNSFSIASHAVNGSLQDVHNVLSSFDASHSFFDGLKVAIMRVMVLGRALAEGWNGFTLSEDTFLKAKELGLLPLIEAIFDFKYRFDNFVEGFKEGWKKVGDAVSDFVTSFAEKVDGTIFEDAFSGITEFIQSLSNNDADAWKNLGEIVGEAAAKFLLIGSAVLVAKSAFSKIMGVVKIVSGLFKFFSGIGKLFNLSGMFSSLAGLPSAVSGIFSSVMSVISGAVSAIGQFLIGAVGAIFTPVGAVIAAAIATIAIYAVTHWEEFKAKVLSIFDTLKEEALNIWNSLKEGIASIVDNFKNAVAPLGEKFQALKDKFLEMANAIWNSPFCKAIIGVLSEIGKILTDTLVPAIKGVIKVISTALQAVWNVIVTVVNAIVNFVTAIISGIVDFISGIMDVITGIFTLNFDKILEGLGEMVGAIDEIVTTFFTELINIIVSVLKGIGETIGSILTAILSTIWGFLCSCWETICNIFNAIAEFLSGLWNSICETVSSIANSIATNLSNIWQGISTTVSNIVTGIGTFMSEAWNNICSTISSIGDTISSTVSNIFNGIKDTITNVIDGAKDTIKKGLDAISGFFSGLKLELPKIKLPHFSIRGSFSIDPPSVPSFGINWYKTGGIFDKPSVIGVGEQGKEAVMPLERNTSWIGMLAHQLDIEMTKTVSRLRPVNTSTQNTTTNTGDTNHYLTNSTNNNTTYEGDTHKSVTFSAGSIVIQCKDTSESEAMKFAKKIMQIIKRQEEIDAMTSYS